MTDHEFFICLNLSLNFTSIKLCMLSIWDTIGWIICLWITDIWLKNYSKKMVVSNTLICCLSWIKDNCKRLYSYSITDIWMKNYSICLIYKKLLQFFLFHGYMVYQKHVLSTYLFTCIFSSLMDICFTKCM